jgi:activator of HSP90 ATPase
MVLHNPNNWHWVNKDASGWTKQWFEENLLSIKAEEGDISAKVDKVISMDGDVDVNQRKGKVITIYDIKLVLEYSGMSAVPLSDCCNANCMQERLKRIRKSAAQSQSLRSPMTPKKTSMLYVSSSHGRLT